MSKEVVVVIIVMVVKTDLWGSKSGMEETGGRDKRGGADLGVTKRLAANGAQAEKSRIDPCNLK